MRIVLACGLVILSFLQAGAQVSVAIVGSSTSACVGPTIFDSCYVGRLNHFYNQAPPNDTSIDNGYAVSGATCFRGMPTSFISPYPDQQPDPAHNITAALASHPKVVIINFPSNGFDIFPLDSILYCLRTMRDSANKAGVPCFVTTSQPRTSGNFANPAIKRKLAVIKDSVLAEFGYFAINFYDGLYNPADSSIRYDAGDGTHMNNTGHDSLYRRVLAKNIFLASLPATFIRFGTTYTNKTGIVSWTTTRETDVAHFDITRSNDGVNFVTIGSVPVASGGGQKDYRFTDAQPAQGLSYYTIVIVDKDGKRHHSPAMRLNTGLSSLSLQKIYAQSPTRLSLDVQDPERQHGIIRILNSVGTVITELPVTLEAGNNTLFLGTPALAHGIYILQLNTGKQMVTGSFAW